MSVSMEELELEYSVSYYEGNHSEDGVANYYVEDHLFLRGVEMLCLEVFVHEMHAYLHQVPTRHKNCHECEAKVHSCVHDVVNPQMKQSEESKHGVENDHAQNDIDCLSKHYHRYHCSCFACVSNWLDGRRVGGWAARCTTLIDWILHFV